MADLGDSPRRLQRCLGSTQFLWVPGTHELQKTCVLLYFCASYTHTCALMGTLGTVVSNETVRPCWRSETKFSVKQVVIKSQISTIEIRRRRFLVLS